MVRPQQINKMFKLFKKKEKNQYISEIDKTLEILNQTTKTFQEVAKRQQEIEKQLKNN